MDTPVLEGFGYASPSWNESQVRIFFLQHVRRIRLQSPLIRKDNNNNTRARYQCMFTGFAGVVEENNPTAARQSRCPATNPVFGLAGATAAPGVAISR